MATVLCIANKDSCTFGGEGSHCSVPSSVKCALLIFNVPVALRLCQAETFQNSQTTCCQNKRCWAQKGYFKETYNSKVLLIKFVMS